MFSQGIDEDTASTRREGVRNGDLEKYGAPENREVVSQNDESQFADLSPAASRSNMIPQSEKRAGDTVPVMRTFVGAESLRGMSSLILSFHSVLASMLGQKLSERL